MSDVSADVAQALDIAGQMIDAGIPVFAAPPCPGATCSRKGHQDGRWEYDLPPKWQLTVPTRKWLKEWRPGWALAAVGGHAADFLDEDPRHGGEKSMEELRAMGALPQVFGVAGTPSGGYHHLILPVGERETNGFLPGLDYQGGAPDGKGRAFVWIAPTVKRSKIEPYDVRPYQWLQPPDLEWMGEYDASDGSLEPLRGVILARKEVRPGNERERQHLEQRLFTEEEAQRFCSITLERLEQAEPGSIEDHANAAACQLSHFVPEFWSEDFAFAALSSSLSKTRYDPDHPASNWTAEKFHDVIAGVNGRAPADWEAARKPESVDEVAAPVDAVDALLAEMLRPSQVAEKLPPRMLVQGLLTMDSESWIIGAPGSKKSFVAQDIAAHVASGRSWQGLRVHQGDVVMIVAEGSGGMGPRIKAWQSEHGMAMPENIHILPRPVQAAQLDSWAVLREACRRLAPSLVIIDTQARVTVGLEENSAKEMGVYVEAVRSIREATGACVLTVHHTGRAGGDARGSSAIDGAQTTELKVESTPGALRGKLKSEKQKDLQLAPDVDLLFAVHTVGVDEDGQEITSLALVGDPFKKAAGRVIEKPPMPGEWTKAYVAHNSPWQQRIAQIFYDTAGIDGLTESKIKESVRDRWGEPKDKDTWNLAWVKVRDLEVGGERFVVPVNGRWALNLSFREVIGKVAEVVGEVPSGSTPEAGTSA